MLTGCLPDSLTTSHPPSNTSLPSDTELTKHTTEQCDDHWVNIIMPAVQLNHNYSPAHKSFAIAIIWYIVHNYVQEKVLA